MNLFTTLAILLNRCKNGVMMKPLIDIVLAGIFAETELADTKEAGPVHGRYQF
jgi:hypothetical protein